MVLSKGRPARNRVVWTVSQGRALSRTLSPTSSASMPGGQRNIRIDAAVLGAFTGYPVVLANRQGELAEAFVAIGPQVLIQRVEVLHGAFAERLLADDHATLVVLYRGGEDFGCGCAEAIDQYRQWAIVGNMGARVRIIQSTDTAVRIA